MMLSRLARASLRLVRLCAGLLISPFGYFKELIGLAVVLGIFLWFFNAVATSLPSKDAAHQASQGLPQIAISRLLLLPAEGRICLLRDHREILVIDEMHGDEQFIQVVPAVDSLDFHRNEHGWGYLTNCIDTGFQWWTSTQGPLETPSMAGRSATQSVALAANEELAAVLDLSGVVQIWRPNAEGVIQILSSYSIPKSRWVYLSPAGDVLAARCSGNEIRFLDALTGKDLRPPVQFSDLVTCTAWSADGEYFAFGLERGGIQVCATHDGEGPLFAVPLTAGVSAIAVSHDGACVVVGTSSGELCAFQQGQPAWSEPAHRHNVRVVKIAEDRDRVVSGGMDGKISIRSLTTGAVMRELTP